MIPFPGLMAMPTVLLNAALSLGRERGTAALGPDRLAAVAPMYDEEASAARALGSLLSQTEPFDEVLVSVNGGTDATPAVVMETLVAAGFTAVSAEEHAGCTVTRWRSEVSPTAVVVVEHDAPVSKARSVNLALERGLVTAERVLVVDGDTELHPGFVTAVRRETYRLVHRRLPEGGHGYVLEDAALVSGAVRSLPGATPQSRLIAAARDAEYAFAAVVRGGQCRRVGDGALLGRSRLYTVVGCGFVARRDVLPVPDDTLTEDHDLTLAAQNLVPTEQRFTAEELDRRGFRLVVNGRDRPLATVIGARAVVRLRRGSDARFVPSALMRTEDPPHLGGLLRQVERWNAGGIENALKRVAPGEGSTGLAPNVAFAVYAAQVENVLGLLLALLLPALLGVRYALPHLPMPAAALAAWLGLDLLLTLLLVLAGARRLGSGWPAALGVAARGVAPLLALRALNALAYVTAATRVLPAFAARRRAERAGRARPAVATTWVRPRSHVGRSAHVRTAGVAATVLLLGLSAFVGAVHVARATVQPGDAWRYLYASRRLDQGDFEILPLPSLATAPAAAASRPAAPEPDAGPRGLSPYCAPGMVGRGDGVAARGEGDPRRLEPTGDYAPLSPWGLLMLARLAPLLTHLEEAATAYGLDAGFLLQVLVNESYLDPLAQGPTGDLGLAQVTSDALTLLAAVSADPSSPLHNPHLFARRASAYDPEFSLCAGAAKLAWAASQPHGDDREVAYARYINPLDGVRDGVVAPTHVELVAAMVQVGGLVDRLAAVVAAYRVDPDAVTPQERALLEVAGAVAAGDAGVERAYARVAALAAELGIEDAPFYAAVLDRLYGASTADAGLEAVTALAPGAPASR